MAKQDVTKIEGITKEEAENLKGLQEYQAALQEDETPEEKELRKLMDLTPSPEVKKAIGDRLKALQSNKATSEREVIGMVKESGYPLAYVVRMGFSKIENQESYQIKARAKREAEKAE